MIKRTVFVVEQLNRLRTVYVDSDSDDQEEEEEKIKIMLFSKNVRLRGKTKHLTPSNYNYLEDKVPFYNISQFKSHFRMAPEMANILENLISPLIVRRAITGRTTVTPRKQLLSVIWLLATPDSYRSIGEQFSISKASLHHCFRRVIYALCQIAQQEIRWPQGAEAITITRKFQRLGGLPNVIGAIDGCHIQIDAPKEQAEAYRTGKKKYAVQLQAVVTTDLIFTDVFSGYPGSVHDARVLKNSPLYRDSQQVFIGEEYILGDKAYPVLTWCIPPYKNTGNLSEAELRFNKKVSSTRQVVERSFALLKGRFRRLKYLVMYRTDELPVAILAICVLHNLCKRGLHDTQEDLNEYIREGADPVMDIREEFTENEETHFLAVQKRNSIRDSMV